MPPPSVYSAEKLCALHFECRLSVRARAHTHTRTGVLSAIKGDERKEVVNGCSFVIFREDTLFFSSALVFLLPMAETGND